MVVLNSAVMMSTARDVQSATQRPQADSDERNADNPFAPRRENVDRRQQIAQDDGEQCHDNDARRVAKPPGPPCKPTTPAILDREWSDGREVVWSGEDVKQAGQKAGQRNQRHADSIVADLPASKRERPKAALVSPERECAKADYGPGKNLGDGVAAVTPEVGWLRGVRSDRSKMTD